MSISVDWKRWSPGVALGGAGLALAVMAPVTWREAATAGGAALAALVFRSRAAAGLALGFGYAILAASAVARGGPGVRAAVAALALAGLVAMIVARPRRWPMHLVPAVLLGALLAAALPLGTSWLAGAPLARAEVLTRWPLLVGCFAAVLLLFSRQWEPAMPRWLLVLGLAASGAIGVTRLAAARTELAQARRQPEPARFERAVAATREAGWTRGEREARLGQARALLRAGEAAAAVEAIPAMLAVDGPTLFARADALAARAVGSGEMEVFRKGLARHRGEPIELSDEGAARLGLWASRGNRPEAPALLARGAGARGGERYLAEAALLAARRGDGVEAERLAAEAVAMAPESPWALCAAAAVSTSSERARACLARVPTHGPSLRILAAAGDAQAREQLDWLQALPSAGASFGGVIRLFGISLGSASVRVGEKAPVELALEVLGNLAPGERYLPLLHLYGSRDILVADAAVPPLPDWIAGQLIRIRIDLPFDGPADRYRLLLGFSPAEGGSRLLPAGQPSHLDIYEFGAVEVRP